VAEADWHNPDLHLPATGEHIGEFEELLRMTVSATAPELAGKLGLIKHEESEFNLSALNNPYTTLTGFDWPDPKTEPGAAGDNASCFMGAIDGFYTASIRFNVAWFEQEYGIAPDELNRQFESLYEQYSNQTDDYLTSREDFSTSIFRYGSVVVTRITRREPADMAGLDYTIKPPSWNLLLEELQHGDLY